MENLSLKQYSKEINDKIIYRLKDLSDNDLLLGDLKSNLYASFEIKENYRAIDNLEGLKPSSIIDRLSNDILPEGITGQIIECAIYEIPVLGDIKTSFFIDWFGKKFSYLSKRGDYKLNLDLSKLTFEEFNKTNDQIKQSLSQKINHINENFEELNKDIAQFNLDLKQFIENSINVEKNIRIMNKDKLKKYTL